MIEPGVEITLDIRVRGLRLTVGPMESSKSGVIGPVRISKAGLLNKR
jgi:hypothetical protein